LISEDEKSRLCEKDTEKINNVNNNFIISVRKKG